MQLTSHLLNQLIKEAMQDDLEFLRDVRYSGVGLEDYIKIISIYQSAQQAKPEPDVVTLQYIDDMDRLLRHAHGRLFTIHEINLVKRFFEDDIDEADESDFMGHVMKDDFANFIRRDQMAGQRRFAMATQLWPLVHFVHNETKAERYDTGYSRGPSWDLEPI